MMLEVDVEGNQILLTEPLAPQAIDNGNTGRDRETGSSSFRSGYGSPHYVFGHFLAGLLALFALAVIVTLTLTFRKTMVQCDGARGNRSIFDVNGTNIIYSVPDFPGNISNCNSVIGVYAVG